MMLVHVVNSSNSSLYANYLQEMVKIRRHSIFDEIDDSLDFIEGVEFLLVFSKNGQLLEISRFTPTQNTKCVSKGLANFIAEEVEFGPELWEHTKFVSDATAETASLEKSNAYVTVGVLEWAMTKGIKLLVAVARKPFIDLAKQQTWPIRQIGPLVQYKPGLFAAAIEIRVSKRILDAARAFFGLNNTVTFTAPPPLDYRTITIEQIRFLDAALEVNAGGEGQYYS
ncbi:MAG: acyl-homoserine-lactone synthase [Pseudomonadota bacterium]